MSENKADLSAQKILLKAKEWQKYFAAKSKIILAFFIVGGILGGGYSLYYKPTYSASLTFVLANDSKTTSSLASLAGQFGVDVAGMTGGNSAFEGDNIMELLKTERIVRGALFVRDFQDTTNSLINLIGKKSGLFKRWEKNSRIQLEIPFPIDENKLSPIQDSLVKEIYLLLKKKFIDVSKSDKKSSFYTISTTSGDENISIRLTKNLVAIASKFYIDTKTKTARDNLRMLHYEADSLKGILDGFMHSAAERIDQTFNLNPALQTQRVPIQQNQIQAQVLSTAYGEVIKNLEIAKITLQKETPLYQVIDEPRLPLIKKDFGMFKGVVLGGLLGLIIILICVSLKKIFIELITSDD